MHSQLRSNKERIGFVLFVTIIGSLVWLTHSSASEFTQSVKSEASLTENASQRGQSDSSCPTCSPAKQRMIYAPLIDLPESSDSEIVLNCRSAHELSITPIFYTLEGETFTGLDIVLKPAEIRFINTKSLIPAKERNRHKWGGMAFSYFGGFMEAWAQLTLHGIRGGGSINVLFTVLSQKRSNTADAVWWTPRAGSAVIALGNSSDQQIHANLIFSTGGSRSVEVAPFGTEIVRLQAKVFDTASDDRIEAVSLSYTGPAGSLIPTGYTASDNGKFSSMIRFYDTQHIVQPDLFANNLRVKNAKLHLVLRNVSANFVKATPSFLPGSGDQANAVTLQTVRLAPSETIEINLSPLARAALNRMDLDSVSVKITNTGDSGSLIGALYSTNDQTHVTYDVPLRDSGPVRASTGGYPIRLDHDYTTVISISNTTDKTGDFTMQLNYEGGAYVIGMVRLAPGATKLFDIRKIRDEQKPDVNGHPLPRNLQIAQARWSIRHNIRLNGRSEVVSLKDGVSSSYSCSLCCPNTFGAGWIAPINYGTCPNWTTPTDTLQFTAYEQDFNGPYCGGNGEPYPAYAIWESSDECVGTIDTNGLATGIAGGATTISCYWDVYYWEWDDLDESCNESEAPYETQNCLNVTAELTSISPDSGLIGTTVPVDIHGSNFSECQVISISISGTGVSASSIDWHNTGLLTADFQIASNATPGNHTVTVSFNGVPTNSENFYVQVPTSLSVVSITVIPSSPIKSCWVCLAGQDTGIQIATQYQVMDQRSPAQPILSSAMAPEETITNLVIGGVSHGNPRSTFGNLGGTCYPTGTSTDSDGKFLDAPFGWCDAAGTSSLSVDQVIRMTVGSNHYNVRTQSFTGTASGLGHGNISNGGDVSASR
jgi:hypothetical protein